VTPELAAAVARLEERTAMPMAKEVGSIPVRCADVALVIGALRAAPAVPREDSQIAAAAKRFIAADLAMDKGFDDDSMPDDAYDAVLDERSDAWEILQRLAAPGATHG
jgi:hypothetical protein